MPFRGRILHNPISALGKHAFILFTALDTWTLIISCSLLLFVSSFVPKLKIILLTSVVFNLQSTFSSIASMFSAVVPDTKRLHMLGSVTWTLRQFDEPIMTVFVFVSAFVVVKFGSPSQSKFFYFVFFRLVLLDFSFRRPRLLVSPPWCHVHNHLNVLFCCFRVLRLVLTITFNVTLSAAAIANICWVWTVMNHVFDTVTPVTIGQRRNLKRRLFKELNQPIDYTPKYTFKC